MSLQSTRDMEVSYTVVDSRKEAALLCTEKAFLGRLCESIAAYYLKKEKNWKIIGKNQRFKFAEVDLIAQCLNTNTIWIVEVRGRLGKTHPPVMWLAPAKINKLKTVARFLGTQSSASHRILFLQVLITKLEKPSDQNMEKDRFKVRADISEYEIYQDS